MGKRIDIHHHIFPGNLRKSERNQDLGWRTPEENLPWTPQKSLESMDALNVDMAILSYPAGVPFSSPGSENKQETRTLNLFAKNLCQEYPDRFGFFASLPDLRDVQGALDELAFVMDNLHADGISLSSSYGAGEEAVYIADDKFDPIWEELDKRHCVVFLHGTQTPSSNIYPHPFLGVPITEAPHETFKAASHLVVTGKKRRYPNVRIILAHMGGTMPFLAPRVAVLSRHMGSPLTPEEILEDFKTFYFDVALSAYKTNFDAIKSFIGENAHNQLLYGTDFPAVSTDMARWFTDQMIQYYKDDRDGLERVIRGNALDLFPRFKSRVSKT